MRPDNPGRLGKIGLAILLALSLAACSGGGGSSGHTAKIPRRQVPAMGADRAVAEQVTVAGPAAAHRVVVAHRAAAVLVPAYSPPVLFLTAWGCGRQCGVTG